MSENTNVKFTIAFNDSDLEPEELEGQAQQLVAELRQMDELDAVDRVLDSNLPEGSKSMGGALVGLLTAEVNAANAGKLLEFLGDRLGGKPIEMAVEKGDRKLSVKAHSREELEAAVKAALEFVGE